jgi:glycolate oxidase FAD binding subunit
VESVDGVRVGRIEHAGTIADVQALVRELRDAGGALVASGLGAHLDLGGPPARVDVLLRLDRLATIVDHQAADMTVTVEAGCPLARLDEVLRAAGQWLPLDPPRFDATTVGGLVAANLAGPLRASQGTVRDLLLGLRVVDGEGRVVRGGGRVVKNVAGYDLPKLHVGALGTLGVVVEATFKVRPRPAREAAIVLRTRAFDDATTCALAVRAALDPLWLEVATRDDAWLVAAGVAGVEAEVVAALGTIETIATRHAAAIERVDDGAAALRHALAAFGVEPAAAVLRASVLPGDVAWAIARLRARAPLPVSAHVANGVVRARVADAAAVAPLVRAVRPELEGRGGFLVVERATPAAKATLDVWGDAGEGLGLMRRVKAAFDPHGVFAPGRYVGGL